MKTQKSKNQLELIRSGCNRDEIYLIVKLLANFIRQ